MEANKDQALKCRDIGFGALKAGDPQKALRMFEKSHRMYPDPTTQSLLLSAKLKCHVGATGAEGEDASAQQRTAGNNGNESKSNLKQNNMHEGPSTKKAPETVPMDASGARHRFRKPTSPSESPSPSRETSAVPSATAEQEQLCRRILGTEDHYQVLGVAKNATEDQIKKAYKKLAFQLHPDKNKATNAEEAFKRISKAFQCLSDANKRALYDQYGNDEEMPQQYRTQYEADFLSPEELFEAFFGMDFGNGRRRVYRRVRRAPATEQQQRFANFVQMLPLLILLTITILTSVFHQPATPKYEYVRSSNFPVERMTPEHRVKYFVPRDFLSEFPLASRQLSELEVEVEMVNFASLCGREQNDKLRQIQLASFQSRSEEERIRRIQQIESTEMKNCRVYASLRERHGATHGSNRLMAGR